MKTQLFSFKEILQKPIHFSLLFLFFIITNLAQAQTYCASAADAPWQQWVAQIDLNNISNASEKCLTTCGYSDFTNISTTLSKGQNYTMTLTAGLSWNNPNADLWWKVWIDLNNDGTFDSNENLVSTNGNGAVQTGIINIPTSATNGPTRMRVSLKKSAYATACESFGPGEVEDYTVDLQGGSTGSGDCADVSITPRNLTLPSSGGNFDIVVTNPGNVNYTIGTEPNPVSWIILTPNTNSINIEVLPFTNATTASREVNVIISCGQSPDQIIHFCDIIQAAPPIDNWTDEHAGLGLLANEIQLIPIISAKV